MVSTCVICDYITNMRKIDGSDVTDLILASQKSSVPLPEGNETQTTYTSPHLYTVPTHYLQPRYTPCYFFPHFLSNALSRRKLQYGI